MEWLEQNIDAYRIVSEILGELRLTVRQRLEQIHGDEWYRKGLPDEVFKRLIAAKEREKSIDWYEGQYQQIMDYAVFADLLEILEHSPDAFSSFTSLAPSTALLNARFLELDVMRAKLGRARPISETELSFLGTFHLRFRKAVEEAGEASDDVFPPREQTDEHVDVTAPDPELFSEAESEPAPVSEPPEETPPPSTPSPPRRAVQTDVDDPTATAGAKVDGKEPDDSEEDASAPNVEDQTTPKNASEEASGAEEDDAQPPAETDDPVEEASKTIGPKKLEDALDSNDHRAVLRELYREVTGIAEGVWSSEITPAPLVWEKVTASDWYEVNFSRLNLQPLSVFYEVTAKVDKKVRGGADKKELQEFLKETNFAKTLLSLRDMFQANNI